jgi:hypothetical protein
MTKAMDNSHDMKNLLSQVDSIQRRFLESLVTGQRDPMFKKTRATRRDQTEDGENLEIASSDIQSSEV